MRSWKKPTNEQLDAAASKLTDLAQVRHFFDNVQNPEWIQPLRERDFFSTPPEPFKDANGALRHPPWPQIFYLDRMATDVRYSGISGEIVREHAKSKNVSVISKIMDIALKLEPNDARPLVQTIITWIPNEDLSHLHKEMGELGVRLLEAGLVDEGMLLTRELLQILPPSEGADRDEPRPRPRTIPEPYWYGHVIGTLAPALAKHVGLPTLDLVLGLLTGFLDHARKQTKVPHDASHIWRPAIETDREKRYDRVENSILTAARDIAEEIVRSGAATLADVLRTLDSGAWNAHRRLAWHILRVFGDRDLDEVARRLQDKEKFDDDAFRHEYYLLAKQFYPKMPQAVQKRMIALIMEGPYDVEEWAGYVERRLGAPPTNEVREKFVNHWRRDRLAAIVEYADADIQRTYHEWISKYGDPEHHEATFVLKGGFGPVSPIPANELAQKSDDELLVFLRDYKDEDDDLPVEGWEGVGLARALEEVVASNPARFLLRSHDYANLRPRFVNAILDGLAKAIKAEASVDWTLVIEYMEAAVATDAQRYQDRESSMAMSSLLDVGFNSGKAALPYGLRERAWALLAPATRSPDPLPEDDAERGTGFGDAPSFSINTARGTALRAAIRYALWAYRELKATHQPTLSHDIPETRAVLDEHLDADPNASVRSAYGELLPWIILMDSEWTRARFDDIFPTSDAQKAYRDAAWQGYMQLGQTYNEAFTLARREYTRAIDDLDPNATQDERWQEHHLAEHLMMLYWRGKISWDDDDRLTQRFFERAPLGMRAHAINFIGISLHNADEEISAEVTTRLKSLYEWRLAQNAEPKELEEFARWYASGKFDDDWSHTTLLKTLERTGFGFEDHIVLETVSESKIPASKKLDIFEAIRARDPDRMGFTRWEEEVRGILVEAIPSDDPATRERAAKLVDELIHKGLHRFRDIGAPASSPRK